MLQDWASKTLPALLSEVLEDWGCTRQNLEDAGLYVWNDTWVCYYDPEAL